MQKKIFLIPGSGPFAMVQKGCYLGASVVIKKLHTGTAAEVTKVFMKEAKYLSEIKRDNIIALFGVCEKPVYLFFSIMEI